MILPNLVDITLSHRNKGHYRGRGYTGVPGEILKVPLEDVLESAVVTVRRQCDDCLEIAVVKIFRRNQNYGLVCSTCARKRYGRRIFTKKLAGN
jgi:hypothetical protein